MKECTRREAIGAAALGGTVAIAAMASFAAQAQDDEPKPEFDEEAERKKVIQCGMTEAEADCWLKVADAAGSFFELPVLHPMDVHEVTHAIHVIQNKLLGRPTYRQYKKVSTAQ